MHRTIENRLKDAIDCAHLEVVNESGMHSVPPGSESHFKVVVVSNDFLGRPLVQRHRRINQALFDQFDRGLHALAIHAYTIEEWERVGQSPPSPPCKGAQH